MAYANSRSMPTLDYVSIVSSLYKDRRAMAVGTASTVIGIITSAVKADAPILYGFALAFTIVTALRYWNMVAFEKANIDASDRTAAEHWELRATILGVIIAFLFGSWCFSALVFVQEPFAELMAISVTVAAMIGIATRNFGIDRLITLQSIALGTPLALGLFAVGDIYHFILAAMLIPMMVSFRFLAADVRAMLLAAVHDRVAASRLAGQLDTALETMHHGLCMLDENGIVAIANDRAETAFEGVAEGNWVGQSFADLLTEVVEKRALPERTAERLLRMIEQQSGGKIVMQLAGDVHCEVTVSSRQDRTVLLFENVTDRVRTQERISFMARYDGLTGLPNRAHFTEQAEADIANRRRNAEIEPAMLMIIDLDDFKHINDSLGHIAGDKVLVETASRLQSVVHRSSQIARLGGDEFVIYRATNTSARAAVDEASDILAALSHPFDLAGERIELGASIGYVLVEGYDTSLDDLTTRADLALYRAKARGKGQHQEFIEEMDGEFRYRQRLKADLKDAIAQHQIKIVYQPIIDIRTRQVAGCEALARWTHPELGPIPPMTFIALAEDMGLVSDITRYVLETATAECRNWPAPITVAVNVSGRDLRTDLLNGYVTRALEKSGLSPDRLEIEVTETALIEEREVAAKRLQSLAARGIGIALDDFGTGYSSLSYLHTMPFTKLKIDRSFVTDIATSERSRKLMSNVARLGRDLDLVLTAEGVETEEQLETITAHTDIDQIQGYLFGMPLPASEIATFIKSTAAARPDDDANGFRRAQTRH